MTFDISKLEEEIKERGNIHQLDNGITVISENNPNSGLVQGSINITAGSLHDAPEDHGVMHFLEHMTFNGSRNYKDPSEMMRRAGIIGLNLNASTSLHSVSFPVHGANKTDYLLQTNALEAFRMIADNAFYPSLDAATLEKERAIVQREREEKEHGKRADDPFMMIGEAMDQRLYRNNLKILNYSQIGTQESIDRITINTLREYHERFFVGENTIVSIGGDLNGTLQREIEKLFDGVPRGVKAPRISYNPEEPFHGREVIEFSAPIRSVDVFVYFQIPNNTSEVEGNSKSLFGINYVLGAAPHGLLFQDLRERRGLVYSVACNVLDCGSSSYIRIQYKVDSTRLDDSLQAVEENLHAIKNGAFSSDLIKAYKAADIPKALCELRQPGWVYNYLARKHQVEQAGLRWQGFDELRDFLSLKKQDVVDAANKYLTEDRLMFIVRSE